MSYLRRMHVLFLVNDVVSLDPLGPVWLNIQVCNMSSLTMYVDKCDVRNNN